MFFLPTANRLSNFFSPTGKGQFFSNNKILIICFIVIFLKNFFIKQQIIFFPQNFYCLNNSDVSEAKLFNDDFSFQTTNFSKIHLWERCANHPRRCNQCQPQPPVTQQMWENRFVSMPGSHIQASAQGIRLLGGSEASKSAICMSTNSHKVRSAVYDQHFLLKRNKWEHIQVSVEHPFH